MDQHPITLRSLPNRFPSTFHDLRANPNQLLYSGSNWVQAAAGEVVCDGLAPHPGEYYSLSLNATETRISSGTVGRRAWVIAQQTLPITLVLVKVMIRVLSKIATKMLCGIMIDTCWKETV